jgi:outer membrane lipoprotein-sorting protein
LIQSLLRYRYNSAFRTGLGLGCVVLVTFAHGQGALRVHRGDLADQSWKTSPDVPPILVKAIEEQRVGHYTGRVLREFEKGAQNLKHQEIVFRDGKKTRIEFPPGSKYSGQIIVENGQSRLYYKPDENTLYVQPALHDESFGRLVSLARRAADKRITLNVESGERVAGISTQQVVVHDRFNTVTQRIFIDPNSGVVLKRIVFDSLGAQTGYFMFVQINLNPGAFSASLFQLSHSGAKVVTPADSLRQVAETEGFEPVVFPTSTGFQLEQSRVATIEKEKVLVESFGSDRGRVTLFELKNSVSQDRLKRMAHGDNQVYSWQRGGKWYVLIGPKSEQQFAERAQTLYTGTP